MQLIYGMLYMFHDSTIASVASFVTVTVNFHCY